MRTVALASGSNGNAIYVETSDARLLFDAGVSGKRVAERGRARGVDIARVDAVVLSHCHHDHVAGAGVLARRYGVPVYASRGTWSRIEHKVGTVAQKARFRPGETVTFGATTVHTLPTPHDAPGSVAFVVEADGRRLGILTDLGHAFERLYQTVETLDAAYLESNYDPEMLATGAYPLHLQDRIAGSAGHLSNDECRDVALSAGRRLQWLAICHLSGENNTPALALDGARAVAARGIAVHLAPRDGPSPALAVDQR